MTKLKVKWQRKSAHLSWGCPLSVNAILLNVPGSYGFDSPDSKPDANALQCVIAVHVVLKICVVRRIHRVFWTGFGTHRHTDRKRHTDTQTDRQTGTQTHRQTDRQTDTQTDTQTHRHTHRQTNRQKQTHKHTDRETDRQTDRQQLA